MLLLFSDFFNGATLPQGVLIRKERIIIGKEVEDWIGERKSRLLLNSMRS